MRRNPQHLAWTVTLAAFAIFCTLAVIIPLTIRWYLTTATRAYEAKVTCLEGTAVVEDPEHGEAIPVLQGETISVPEGTVVSVDATAQALISFFDQSLAKLFPRSSVALEQMRAPRFGVSLHPAQITLQAKGGRVRANTVLRGSWPVEFRVKSLQADALLSEDGNYTLEVTNEWTEVIVERGMAELSATAAITTSEAASVLLSSRQRSIVETGKLPLAPLKAERDLVINGDFVAPLGTGWQSFNDQGADGGEVDGVVSLVVDELRRAARFRRTGGEFNHCETGIEQQIDRDLPDPLSTLKVKATIKLVNQSLSGGGYLSSEYPLMIVMRYRDVYQSENEWVHGFYYQNVDNNPTMYGEQIGQNEWYFYESENLVGVLPVAPRRILSLHVYASGWSYDSLVAEISLLVE
ncbi:MAG: hypothetical protein AMJ93_01355 [Anaerolineae bacterium SM23_84]|nr:MAG: hypothetical protein AMJ93_01355 [Anaerolineae bacterium SM23_84]